MYAYQEMTTGTQIGFVVNLKLATDVVTEAKNKRKTSMV